MSFTNGGSAITLNEPGTYLIQPYIAPDAAGSFAVERNGELVAGGTLPNNGSAASGPVVITAQAGDTVSVVNTGTAAANLPADAAAPNATVRLQRLGD